MTGSHPLDWPVWSALTTKQAEFAVGSPDSALRFQPGMNALGAAKSQSRSHLWSLSDLTPQDEKLALYSQNAQVLPPTMALVIEAPCYQMVGSTMIETPARHDVVPLTQHDVDEMIKLARASRVGSFSPKSYLLGKYFGVWQQGKLIGMVGQRLRLPGYVEISAVCTHPTSRRLGIATALLAAATREIVECGDRAFLHVRVDNLAAISLYEQLGFRRRRVLRFNLMYRT